MGRSFYLFMLQLYIWYCSILEHVMLRLTCSFRGLIMEWQKGALYYFAGLWEFYETMWSFNRYKLLLLMHTQSRPTVWNAKTISTKRETRLERDKYNVRNTLRKDKYSTTVLYLTFLCMLFSFLGIFLYTYTGVWTQCSHDLYCGSLCACTCVCTYTSSWTLLSLWWGMTCKPSYFVSTWWVS